MNENCDNDKDFTARRATPPHTAMNTIEWPVSLPARTGAMPVWHPGEKRLYWCDPAGGDLYRFNPEDGSNELCLTDRPIGAMTLQADGSLLLFRDQANIVVLRNGAVDETVIASIAEFRLTQFASAAADPRGRVICSVLSDSHHTGRLMRLDTDGRLEFVADGFGIPGAMAFDETGTRLYFNDAHSTHLVTWRYDYDPETGTIGERRPFYRVLDEDSDESGAPMGLAIDADENVWIARWGGARIVRHAPDGAIAATEQLPVRKPFGIAFGGDDLADIYITTAGGHRRSIEGLHAGDLARMRVEGVKGRLPFRSRIGLA